MTKQTALICMVCIVLASLAGCVPLQNTAPPPAVYSFVYAPPEQSTKFIPITIALVRPSYEKPDQISQQPRWAQKAGEAFMSSMKTDIEKILVAKGFKITGPFDKLDVMTYPEKQGANLTLTPIINVSAPAKVTSQTGTGSPLFPRQENGVFVFSGWIALVMIEPLSGEKMWIKRIEVDPIEESFIRKYYIVQSQGREERRVLEDTQEQALVTGLNRLYPKVLQQAWTYFHPDEIMHVKQQADEVRKLKRY